MAFTIAISNHKGGVAKTTSCISLGACLAEAGKRTLIVDFDPQSNLTMATGFEPEELELTVVDLLDPEDPQDRVEALAVIQPTSPPGLSLLPADQRLVELEINPQNNPGYEGGLQSLLASLSKKHLTEKCLKPSSAWTSVCARAPWPMSRSLHTLLKRAPASNIGNWPLN